jgi:hypothetical protein
MDPQAVKAALPSHHAGKAAQRCSDPPTCAWWPAQQHAARHLGPHAAVGRRIGEALHHLLQLVLGCLAAWGHRGGRQGAALSVA